MSLTRQQLPLWLKIACTAYVGLLVPTYAVQYPLSNFLWFCNIALLMTAVALWFENRLMISMALLAVLVPEVGWNLDFFAQLIFDKQLTGHTTAYMFMEELHPFVRSLSLYHVLLPIALLAGVWRLGYDRRAWWAQSILACVVLVISYLASDPERNVNFVFGIKGQQQWAPEWLYLLAAMVVVAIVLYGPAHLLLLRLFGTPGPYKTVRHESEADQT